MKTQPVPDYCPSEAGTVAEKRKRVSDFWWQLRCNRLALCGAAVLALFAVVALLAPWLAPYSPTAQNLPASLQPPGPAHLLGTDEFGRDILSRIIFGARFSLPVGIFSVAIALAGGGLLGMLAGYYGGRLDNLIMRVMDVMLALPTILLAIVIVTALGPGLTNVMVAVGISLIPHFARVAKPQSWECGNWNMLKRPGPAAPGPCALSSAISCPILLLLSSFRARSRWPGRFSQRQLLVLSGLARSRPPLNGAVCSRADALFCVTPLMSPPFRGWLFY